MLRSSSAHGVQSLRADSADDTADVDSLSAVAAENAPTYARASAGTQLQWLLWKNFTVKMRGLRMVLIEVLGAVGFILLLTVFYSLIDWENQRADQYVNKVWASSLWNSLKSGTSGSCSQFFCFQSNSTLQSIIARANTSLREQNNSIAADIADALAIVSDYNSSTAAPALASLVGNLSTRLSETLTQRSTTDFSNFDIAPILTLVQSTTSVQSCGPCVCPLGACLDDVITASTLTELVQYSGPILNGLLTGPFRVGGLLPLDLFVMTSRLLDSIPGFQEVYRLAGPLASNLGINIGRLGNLGPLSFVPATADAVAQTTNLVRFLLSESVTMPSMCPDNNLNGEPSCIFSPPGEAGVSAAISAALDWPSQSGRTTSVNSPWAVIVVHEADPKLGRFNVSIRSNHRCVGAYECLAPSDPSCSVVPSTSSSQPTYPTPAIDYSYVEYWVSGFLALEDAIAAYAFYETPQQKPDTFLVPMPTPKFRSNSFYSIVGPLLGLVVVLSSLYPFAKFLSVVVVEKESRMLEIMKIMGLREWADNIAWPIFYCIYFLFIALLSAAVAKGSFFGRSDYTGLFLLFYLYYASTVFMCQCMSAFFTRAKTASIIGPIIMFLSVLPQLVLRENTPLAFYFLPGTAVAAGAALVGNAENAGAGLTWSVASQQNAAGASFITVISILLIDCGIYFLLFLYFKEVVPGEYGPQRSCWFFARPSYWRNRLQRKQGRDSYGIDSNYSQVELAKMTVARRDSCVEAPVDDETPAVRLHNLRKVFSSVKKVAVHGLTLAFYRNQITCLLGHNGAGKTTSLSMITGLLPPTSGDCFINGQSIVDDTAKARTGVGICPQQNTLFPTLTVEEHLRFFAALKGVPRELVRAEAVRLIRAVGLSTKSGAYSSVLSGGQQRKLSLGLALAGNSTTIFLDEPTSGMDPYSRRATWTLLQNYKRGRTIILTTHFMDEADILSDRIAIMAEGALCAAGSSLFLKHKFGTGYTCAVETDSGDTVSDMIGRHVKGAQLLLQSGGQTSFLLPYESVATFPALFRKFEARPDIVKGYGVSGTTVEEVFLQVVRQAEGREDRKLVEQGREDDKWDEQTKRSSLRAFGGAPASSATAGVTFRQQLKQMLKKRALCALRDRQGLLTQLLLPLVAVALVLLILKLRLVAPNPPLFLSLSACDKGEPSSFTLAHFSSEIDTRQFLDELSSAPGRSFVQMPQLVNSTTTSQWFLDSYHTHPNHRYFAVVLNDSLVQDVPLNGATVPVVGGSIGEPTRPGYFTLFHNTSCWHSAPSLVTESVQSQLRSVKGSDAIFNVTSFPLPYTEREQETEQLILFLVTSLAVLLPFTFVPAAFMPFLIKERESKAKHLQLVSGTHPIAYWLGAYLWDTLVWVLVSSSTMLLFYIENASAFIAPAAAGPVFLLLISYGMSVISLSYCYSFLFRNPSAGVIGVMSFHMLAGFGAVIAHFVMTQVESTQSIDKVLEHFYKIFPPFNFGFSFVIVSTLHSQKQLLGRYLVPNILQVGCSADEVYLNFCLCIGEYVVLMLVEAVGYWVLAVLIDMEVFSSLRAYLRSWLLSIRNGGSSASLRGKDSLDIVDKDPDVKAEEQIADDAYRSLQSDADVIIHKLRKVFPGRGGVAAKVAVDNLSLCVSKGQSLGFLGVNGAGKTTTMSILTGEQTSTSGSATICGFDVMKERPSVHKCIGFCPQFDPILDLLTAREHLQMFANLKGIPPSEVSAVASRLLLNVGLEMHADRVAGGYSGGNKRKLSLALALVGNPRVLFLDEPSSGMDPVARRHMWDTIVENTQDRSMVLTTHYMDECEALCNRIAIMAVGRLRCIGNSQHLKNRFATGYNVEVKCTHVGPADEMIRRLLPGVILVEAHGSKLRYSTHSINLADFFEEMELRKNELGLEDYGVSQNTLEQVFIGIASKADEENLEVK